MRESSDPEEQELDDSIRPEDGIERHWMYFHGETYRLYALIFGIFCLLCVGLLYLLGRSGGTLGMAFRILTVLSFVGWRALDVRLNTYRDRDWQKD